MFCLFGCKYCWGWACWYNFSMIVLLPTRPTPPHSLISEAAFLCCSPGKEGGSLMGHTFVLDFACWVVSRCHLLPQSFLKLKKLELKSARKCPQGQELQITALFVFLVSFRFGLIMIKSLMLLKDRTIISIFGCLQGAVSRDGLNTSQPSTRNHSNSTWRSSRYSSFTPESCTLSAVQEVAMKRNHVAQMVFDICPHILLPFMVTYERSDS